MSIDNIQLPRSAYESIFKKSLLVLEKNNPLEEEEVKTKIDILGGNEKYIVILLKNDSHTFLKDDQLKFLQGLIYACNLTMADIAIVNFANKKIFSPEDLISQLLARKVLSFGVSPLEISLPFSIPFFQVQSFQEIQYLFSPPLNEIQNNQDAKKLLWVSLQNIFNISKLK